jgi:hypothetical protein
MLGFISLPTNFVTLVSANAGTIFSDLAPAATLIIGVLLGLFVISWVIKAIRGKTYDENDQNYQNFKADQEFYHDDDF